MNQFTYFVQIIFFSFCILKINCGTQPCYEYSCDECDTSEYGTCTKCRDDFSLIDGTCPCSDSGCALCTSGLAGLYICEQCKEGYNNIDKNCVCNVNNCEQCAVDGCKKCRSGYYYNETLKECIKEDSENKIKCFDPGCDGCLSEEQGACEYCKEGYLLKKGECLDLTIPVNGDCPENYYQSGKYCYEKCDGLTCNILIGFRFPYFVLRCQENKCLVCIGNDILIISECDNSNECSELEGCLNCFTNDECLICQQGYYPLGGKCKKCSEGCSICSSQSNCQVCMSGYELTSNHTCNLTYNFDYNTEQYQSKKTELIQIYYPEEIPKVKTTIPIIETIPAPAQSPTQASIIPSQGNSIISTTEEIINKINVTTNEITENRIEVTTVIQTDEITDIKTDEKTQIANTNYSKFFFTEENFIKYYDNLGKYILEFNKKDNLNEDKCNSICSNINCLKCEIKDGSEMCDFCPTEDKINIEQCKSICSEDKCSSYALKGNNIVCNSCINGYYLVENTCKIKCKDENCEICSDDGTQCTECKTDTKLYEGKCAKNKDFCTSYFHCNYCLEEEGCIECEDNYEVKNKTCAQRKNIIWYIIIVIFVILIIAAIIFCIYSKIKKTESMRVSPFVIGNVNDMEVNNHQTYNVRNELSNSIRSILSKDEIAEEYEEQRRKYNKAKMTCMFCHKKPGNYKCECGCVVCKEHSSLKEVEKDGEKYKVCYSCGKKVNKATVIKYNCNICMQNKMSVTHFKCGCAMEVCKNCYIKCKMTNDKCPGCRATI